MTETDSITETETVSEDVLAELKKDVHFFFRRPKFRGLLESAGGGAGQRVLDTSRASFEPGVK